MTTIDAFINSHQISWIKGCCAMKHHCGKLGIHCVRHPLRLKYLDQFGPKILHKI